MALPTQLAARPTPAVAGQFASARVWGIPAGVWFAAPALTIIAVFFLLPIAAAILLSLTDFDIYALAHWRNLRWVGLDNYVQIFRADRFWTALVNTLYYVAVGGPISVAVSLGAALLLESKLTRFKTLWRTIFFAPVVTTLVASAVVWRYLYHTKYGAINHALRPFESVMCLIEGTANYLIAWLETLFRYPMGRIEMTPIDWMGDPFWSMPAIMLLGVWKNFGYNMIIFMAGLTSIPDELYEAARVDGARPWGRFRHITLPQLAPTFLFVSVTTMIGYFQLFAEPYVMTRGGPEQSTYSLVMFMHEEGFRWWRLGMASAIATVLFAITLVATLLQIRLQRRFTT
jgi:multiple sugar transport system permease protein